MKEFTLVDLIPEPLVFVFGSERYQVRTADMLGIVEYAELERLQRLQASGDLHQMADALESFFRRLVPDMPEERVKAVSLRNKLRFLGWWADQHKDQAQAQGEEVAGQAQAQG